MTKHRLWLTIVPLTVAALLLSGAEPQGSHTGSEPASAVAAEPMAFTTSAGDGSALVGEAVFSHEMHIEDLELDCVTCHHETNAGPLSPPHPDYCKDLAVDCEACHHQSAVATLAPQSCANCHHPVPGGIADQRPSAKVAVHQNCWSCHDVGTGVEAAQSCSLCHQDPE